MELIGAALGTRGSRFPGDLPALGAPPSVLIWGCPAQSTAFDSLAHPGVFHWSFQDENPWPPQNLDSSQVLQLCLWQLLLLF